MKKAIKETKAQVQLYWDTYRNEHAADTKGKQDVGTCQARAALTQAHKHWYNAKGFLQKGDNTNAANSIQNMITTLNRAKHFGLVNIEYTLGALTNLLNLCQGKDVAVAEPAKANASAAPKITRDCTDCPYKGTGTCDACTDPDCQQFMTPKAPEPKGKPFKGGGTKAFMTHLNAKEIKALFAKYPYRVVVGSTGYNIEFTDQQGMLCFVIEHSFESGRTLWEYPASGNPHLDAYNLVDDSQ